VHRGGAQDKHVDADGLARILLVRHRDEHALVGRERLRVGELQRAPRDHALRKPQDLGDPGGSRARHEDGGRVRIGLEGHRHDAFRIAQPSRTGPRQALRKHVPGIVDDDAAEREPCHRAHRFGHAGRQADLRNAEVDQRQDDDQAVGLVDDRDADRDRGRASLAKQPGGAAFDAGDELNVRDRADGRYECRGRARVGRVPAQGFADQRSHGGAARLSPTRPGCRSRG
jgi:hypothetical protein